LAASRAVQGVVDLGASLEHALVVLDGNHDYVSRVHPEPLSVRTVVKGDRDCASVSAASVIAKVARDELMVGLHPDHPDYQWDRNKGYASIEHRRAIHERRLSPLHRASWAIADAPTLFQDGVTMDDDSFDAYDSGLERGVCREYGDVVALFQFVVETERRFCLGIEVNVVRRDTENDFYFEISMKDVWVWDIYRADRFVKAVRVLTFKDVNVEELQRREFELPDELSLDGK